MWERDSVSLLECRKSEALGGDTYDAFGSSERKEGPRRSRARMDNAQQPVIDDKLTEAVGEK